MLTLNSVLELECELSLANFDTLSLKIGMV